MEIPIYAKVCLIQQLNKMLSNDPIVEAKCQESLNIIMILRLTKVRPKIALAVRVKVLLK